MLCEKCEFLQNLYTFKQIGFEEFISFFFQINFISMQGIF